VEDFIFGRDNLSWISGSALSEAGLLADYMILRTGMTALGKVYYRTQQDVMLHVSVAYRQSFSNSIVAYSKASTISIKSMLSFLASLTFLHQI
jgi:ATP-dependent Zn protease